MDDEEKARELERRRAKLREIVNREVAKEQVSADILEVVQSVVLTAVVAAMPQTEEEEDRDCVAVPPGPPCERCGHELCPCCPSPWCDTVLPSCEVGEDGGLYNELCCDSECVVEPADFERWQQEVNAIMNERDRRLVSVVAVAVGPWLPEAVRLARLQAPS